MMENIIERIEQDFPHHTIHVDSHDKIVVRDGPGLCVYTFRKVDARTWCVDEERRSVHDNVVRTVDKWIYTEWRRELSVCDTTVTTPGGETVLPFETLTAQMLRDFPRRFDCAMSRTNRIVLTNSQPAESSRLVEYDARPREDGSWGVAVLTYNVEPGIESMRPAYIYTPLRDGIEWQRVDFDAADA